MTTTEVRYHRYSDHRGRPVWVRATRTPGGPWREHWSVSQLMAVDLSNEPDTSPEPVLAHRSVSDSSRGSQPHLNTSTAPRATKNTNRKDHR